MEQYYFSTDAFSVETDVFSEEIEASVSTEKTHVFIRQEGVFLYGEVHDTIPRKMCVFPRKNVRISTEKRQRFLRRN